MVKKPYNQMTFAEIVKVIEKYEKHNKVSKPLTSKK